MENNEGLRLTGFVTSPSQQQKKRVRFEPVRDRKRAGAKRKTTGPSLYLFIRLGVCVLLFCGVFALRLSKGGSQALTALDSTLNGEQRPDTGGLGKLRFVQIPSIIDVFAPSSKPVLPVGANGFLLEDDGALLCLASSVGETVYCPCASSVSAVGEDDELGGFVRLKADKDDTELCIFGLSSVSVERGQPVAQRDILGVAGGEAVRVRVYVSGRPTDPSEYFGLGSMQ